MDSSKEFKGKVAFVTGASSGIGRAAAVLFAKAGARVCIVARREKELRETEDQILRLGGEAERLTGDVTDEGFDREAVAQSVRRFGGIDVLVNAAGIIASGSLADTSTELFDRMMNVNVRSVFFLMREAKAALVERKGSIVNISSVAGTRAFPNVFAYVTSKAAVNAMTQCAALDLAPYGVRVNALNPGVVVTHLHRAGGMTEEAYEKFLEHSKTTHPLGRTGSPEEIAEAILFLAGPRSGWITGETIAIDGGRHLTCAR
ncbi:MAG: glucose 1-dehydrogenase [Acidobacteriia bacterium]|nr:glucose 1-dehydrogenase [Terriglobia bacterium]